MTGAPAAWLGLSWAPDPVYDIALARNLAAVLALGAGGCELRGRRAAALTLALAMVAVSAGFWSAALLRPYGLLVDSGVTRWAADTVVTARAGGTDILLAGEPGAMTPWRMAAERTSSDLVLAVPTLLPPIVLVASVLAIALLWPGRAASLAAMLWIAASTGPLDALRGVGLLDGIWRRPGRAIEWTAAVVMALGLSRLLRRWPRAAVIAVAIIMTAACLRGGSPPRLGLLEAALHLTLDAHVWLVAGVAGLVIIRDPPAIVMAAGGALLVLASAVVPVFDTATASAFARLGLVLGAAPALEALAEGKRWVTAVAVSVALAGSYVAWWDPSRTDPVAKESLAPVPDGLAQATDWIAVHTDPGGVFIAHPDYAPAVAALGGRRVLRAPGYATAPDDERRRRLEQAVLDGNWPEALRSRYGIRYVLLAPGQFSERGLESPEQLAARGSFREIYASGKGLHVYELGEARR